MKTRATLRGHIAVNGKKIKAGRSWEELAAAKKVGLLLEFTPSGLSDWFSIVEGKSIWWVFSDTTDGGSWGPNGTIVTGYAIPYDAAVADSIRALVREERKKKLASNPYSKIK